jgi:hypothetical protein
VLSYPQAIHQIFFEKIGMGPWSGTAFLILVVLTAVAITWYLVESDSSAPGESL